MDLIHLWFRNRIYWGLIGLANRMPRIADDLIEDSMSHDESCPMCDGKGNLLVGEILSACVTCDGVGKVRVPGDVHARRQLFEIMGLIGPRRGRSAAT